MYRNEPLEKYLKDAAAGTPTPGGGSVAALAGALATTMASMAAHCSVGREKFKHYDSQLKKILESCEKNRETLLSLMEEDITAYRGVTNAYGLPKSTEAEKNKRSEEIQKTIMAAMEVPLKTMMSCLYLLEQIRELIGITNPNLISDVGVATYMADAAFQSAKLNVEANLSTIKNQYLVEKVQHEISYAEKKARLFFTEIEGRVREKSKR